MPALFDNSFAQGAVHGLQAVESRRRYDQDRADRERHLQLEHQWHQQQDERNFDQQKEFAAFQVKLHLDEMTQKQGMEDKHNQLAVRDLLDMVIKAPDLMSNYKPTPLQLGLAGLVGRGHLKAKDAIELQMKYEAAPGNDAKAAATVEATKALAQQRQSAAALNQKKAANVGISNAAGGGKVSQADRNAMTIAQTVPFEKILAGARGQYVKATDSPEDKKRGYYKGQILGVEKKPDMLMVGAANAALTRPDELPLPQAIDAYMNLAPGLAQKRIDLLTNRIAAEAAALLKQAAPRLNKEPLAEKDQIARSIGFDNFQEWAAWAKVGADRAKKGQTETPGQNPGGTPAQPLDEAAMDAILDEAGGDPAKAAQIARQRGMAP